MLRTVNIISFDPIQELAYFVNQSAFVELDLFYLVCPLKTILRNFSSCGEVLPPLENFLFKKSSGTGKYTYIFTPQQFQKTIASNTLQKKFRTYHLKGFLRTKDGSGGGHVVSLILIL